MRLDMDTSALPTLSPGQRIVFDKAELDTLIALLKEDGFTVIGPTARDGAILYDEISSLDDLPVGLVDEQEAGTYRLHEDDRGRYFAYTVGPQAWKKFLFPPTLTLWRAVKKNGEVVIDIPSVESPRYAFLGVRACDLAAIGIQDVIFTQGAYVDPFYKERRERVFIVAVNCTRAGNTCFCASMNTGPAVQGTFDIALTELDDVFLAQVGTERGGSVLVNLPHRTATEAEVEEAARRVEEARAQMGRQMETAHLKETLLNAWEHPRWEEVAKRCLACANCTLVCPTCFCFTVQDVTDLTGEQMERVRLWDSCFNLEFTYTAGRPMRSSTAARYRQWLTHKLAGWQEQFGMIGCVGCGRCITWCPVGIDITEEVSAIVAPKAER